MMNQVYTLKLTRAERREKWKELILSYRASRLKKKKFCEINGLRVRDLRRWQYRLSDLKEERVKKNIEEVDSSQQEAPDINFLKVEVQSDREEPVNYVLNIELKHVSGFSLVVGKQTDESLLKKTLRTVIEVWRC